MGLDQYLQYGNETDDGMIYWRKANQIHHYFERVFGEMENCKDYDVSKENIIELKRLCDDVLENPEKADELLPTQAGFFYGSTEYDDWYFEELADTSEKLGRILDYDWYSYHAWW